MKTNYAKMILGADNANFCLVDSCKLRAREQFFFFAYAKLRKARMEIQLESQRIQTSERARCAFKLFPAHADVDIAVGTEALFRIITRCGPSLDQNGLNAKRAEQREDFFDFGFVEPRLKRAKAISFV